MMMGILNIVAVCLVVILVGSVVFLLPAGTLVLSGIVFSSSSALFWFIIKVYVFGIGFEFIEAIFKTLFKLTDLISTKKQYWLNQVIGFVCTTLNLHIADVFSDDVILPLWGKFVGSFLIILIGVIFDKDTSNDQMLETV